MRQFVMKDGKPQIKKQLSRIAYAGEGSDQYNRFNVDMDIIFQLEACAFARKYLPGEFDGFLLPATLDLSEITHTYVIACALEEHIAAHIAPLGKTYKAIILDVQNGKPMLARVPLLPEQFEVLKQFERKEGTHGAN